ncbi:hypothetical protein EDB81DRAFT_845509 [Dactylonectria macrodidyma]|uniref:Uncharacterized protein n=1 Tax=Dactylonectria macrodidyma TaxID=307937 RepID=A0A9P9E2N9_9HYPO|nr:hypothetical protein EDB81DRAFT_845509 [Dactylonectria macrodidyma]
MVNLTIGQVVAIITFRTVVAIIARMWGLTLGTFILDGQLRDRKTVATWTVIAKHLQNSYWPLLLRSDVNKDRGSNEPKSEAVRADFAYVLDSSTFYAGTSTRDEKPFTQTYSLNSYGLSENCSFFGTINPTVPDILHDIYSSGTQYERTTISDYFDIEWRQTTTQYNRHLNNGTPIAAGIFRRLETIALTDDVRAVEGLVVDGKNGGIGFRNHTLPSGYLGGVTWTEDLLFWEPDVECVDTNTTMDFEVTTSSQTTSGLTISKLRLTNRGGFVNFNTTDPLDHQRNGVNKPDLRTRAYRAAWDTNAFSMLFMNISNAIDPRKKNKHFEWINSEIGKQFKIPTSMDDAKYFSLEFISDFGDHLAVPSIISDTDGLFENPYNITIDSFIAARDLCQGTLFDAPTKLSNTFVLCNLIRGVSQRVDDGPNIIFEDRSQWSSPLYACASAVKGTFFHNGTEATIDNLVVREIKDKEYATEDDMPLWGNFQNIWTIRAPSLYFLGTAMNGWIGRGLDPQFTHMNLPASIVPTGAFLTILSKMDNTPSTYDLTGQTTMNLWLWWLELSRSADSVSTIMKLMWTNFATSAVVGTKGVLDERNAQPNEAADISVIPLVHRSSLETLNYRLKQTSLGRVLTTLVDPQSSTFAMTAADWSKLNARKDMDLGLLFLYPLLSTVTGTLKYHSMEWYYGTWMTFV